MTYDELKKWAQERSKTPDKFDCVTHIIFVEGVMHESEWADILRLHREEIINA